MKYQHMKNIENKSKEAQLNNPLHGVKLATIIEFLVDEYGWERLGERIAINCFTKDPSVKSSLKFLRKTPWARTKVEVLYLESINR
jgi:uncharacterized protein (DUF2132 family)